MPLNPGTRLGPHRVAEVIGAVPITCLAHIAFRVSDLEQGRRFYGGVLGFQEAFDIRDSNGGVTKAFFKINDDQYIVVMPNLKEELRRVDHIAVLTRDVDDLHHVFVARGLNPSAIVNGDDGNRRFRIIDPEGSQLDFLQYMPDSLQSRARGRFIDERRISTKVYHFGLPLLKGQETLAFYRDRMGFVIGSGGTSPTAILPGNSGEYLELLTRAVDTETKDPPLDPNVPATRDQYVREQNGSIDHICLSVPDIRVASNLAKTRGEYDDKRVAPRLGFNRHWLMNIFDSDGSRTELMEPTPIPAPISTV